MYPSFFSIAEKNLAYNNINYLDVLNGGKKDLHKSNWKKIQIIIGATVVVPTHYPVGSTKPGEFKELMGMLMPEVIVKEGAGVSFTVTPMRVD